MKRTFILAVLVAGLGARAFGQTEVITNGGFEFGLSGWQASAWADVATTSHPVHSGTSSLTITTVAGTEVVSQPIVIPPSFIAVTLRYYYNIYSVDGSPTPNALLDVYLADMAGNRFLWIDEKDNTARDQVAGRFHPVVFDLTPYAATNSGHLQVQFWVSANSSGGTQFNIDDVSVQVVDASARGTNDAFAGATLVTDPSVPMTANNTYATKEDGEPKHANNAGGKSLWWRWTAPDWGQVTLTTGGSSFDTLLAAYTGDAVNNLTTVKYNDDDNDGRSATSQIRFVSTPGTEYKIAVDGKDGASGNIVLTLNFAPDHQGPKVFFSLPKAGAVLTNAQVTVQGTAQDNVAVARVEYRLENVAGTNDYQLAAGTNHWSATLTNLIPGLNTVRVRAFDLGTNMSATVTRSFYYDVLLPAKGAYAGLFAEADNLASTNTGFFTATVAPKGKFSAKLLLAGRSYSCSGLFDTEGTFSKPLPLPGGAWLMVQLNLDLTNYDHITGSVTSGPWTAALRANKAVYSRTSPASQGGQKYTLVIQNGDEQANQPAGYGFGALTVDTAGNLKFSGTLGDGTKVSQKTFVSKTDEWPLYLSAAAGKEAMAGWLLFTNVPDVSDFNGTVSWMKQPQAAKLYPGGFLFTNGVAVVGSRYTYTPGMPLLDLPSGGQVVLQGGNLPADATNVFSLDKNKLLNTNKLSLALSTAAGTFKGSVPVPGAKKPVAVSGALLQKQNAGFGCFVGTNQTGRVTLGQ